MYTFYLNLLHPFTVFRLDDANLQLRLLPLVKVLSSIADVRPVCQYECLVLFYAVSPAHVRAPGSHSWDPAGAAADWLLSVDYCCYASSGSSEPTEALCSVQRGLFNCCESASRKTQC